MIPAETILFLWRGTVGIAALNPRLNMDYPLAGDRLWDCRVDVAGDLPVAPTATRWKHLVLSMVVYTCSVGARVVINRVYTGSVGASGSSPALR